MGILTNEFGKDTIQPIMPAYDIHSFVKILGAFSMFQPVLGTADWKKGRVIR